MRHRCSATTTATATTAMPGEHEQTTSTVSMDERRHARLFSPRKRRVHQQNRKKMAAAPEVLVEFEDPGRFGTPTSASCSSPHLLQPFCQSYFAAAPMNPAAAGANLPVSLCAANPPLVIDALSSATRRQRVLCHPVRAVTWPVCRSARWRCPIVARQPVHRVKTMR